MTLMGDEPELALGDSGEHVMQLQDRLRGLRLLDKQPDGTYDDATETAVRQLQSNLGHDNDGRVTPETWQALDQHMLSNGLTYNHYAGPANQHWDVEQNAHPADASADQTYPQGQGEAGAAADPQAYHLSEDGKHYWDGQNWQPTDAAQHEQAQAADGEVTVGSLSPDGHWKWDGTAWQPADAQAPAAEDEGPAVIPHFDNIHPAIQQDERFSSFHDFLRENSNQ